MAGYSSAEVSLIRAFVGSGGPVPESGFRLGRRAAQFRYVPIGGPVVGKLRSDLGSGDGQAVHLFFLNASVFIILRRRLGCVLSVLDGISKNGLTLSRDLELSVQWDAIVSAGPCGPLCSANLAISPAVGLPCFGDHVRVLYDVVVVDFLHKVVVYRKDAAARGWRSWMLEDDKVHPYRWLKPDLVAPAPFLCCDPCRTVDGSGLFLIPIELMSNFVLLGFPSFVGQAEVPLIFLLPTGRLVVGSLAQVSLIYLLFSALIFIMLSNIKRASAGGLDGWGWRDLKAFPEAWFDFLAVVLSRVELDGVWPEGLMLHPWAASLVCPACCLPHLGFCQASSLGWLASVLAPSFRF